MSNTFDILSSLYPFIEEVNSYLPEIRANLERLEQSASDMKALEETYLCTHTIGGSASMMDFPDLAHVAHSMEGILADALDGIVTLDALTIALLQRSLRRMQRLLDGIRTSADEDAVIAENARGRTSPMQSSRMVASVSSAAMSMERAAMRAWAAVSAGEECRRVQIVRATSKSLVCRLHAGKAGNALIAKRSEPGTARLERTMYCDVLPWLPVRALNCYGWLERDGDGLSWLFLEDCGDELLGAENMRELAHWLGVLHGTAASLDVGTALPQRGLEYHLANLHDARTGIRANLNNPVLSNSDRDMLSSIVSSCDVIERRWDCVVRACLPELSTVVHGDVDLRNLRLVAGADGLELVAFDWEWSGYGTAAPDLHLLALSPDAAVLSVYAETLARFQPAVDEAQARRLAYVGHGLRLLAAVGWAIPEFETPWPSEGLALLHFYRAPLERWAASLE